MRVVEIYDFHNGINILKEKPKVWDELIFVFNLDQVNFEKIHSTKIRKVVKNKLNHLGWGEAICNHPNKEKEYVEGVDYIG